MTALNPASSFLRGQISRWRADAQIPKIPAMILINLPAMYMEITRPVVDSLNYLHHVSGDGFASRLINPILWGWVTVIKERHVKRNCGHKVCIVRRTVNADGRSLGGDKLG